LLESDSRGPKVYDVPDGNIVKLFRVKRRVSSNLWSPFAKRFATHAERLGQIGLRSVVVSEVAWVEHLQRQMVVYRKLEGVPLRHVLRTAPPERAKECLHGAARFIAEVQEKGVFFRSFHFGNILVCPDGGYALIDVLDVWFKRSPLGLWRRRRNLRHMSRYREDRKALLTHWDAFRAGYLEVALAGSMQRYEARLAADMDAHRQRLVTLPDDARSR